MEKYSAEEVAQALVDVLGDIPWEACALAHGYSALLRGRNDEQAAREIFTIGRHTLKKSRELVVSLKKGPFLELMSDREKTGSAENPITKLFPARVTEQRFLELLGDLSGQRPSISYEDDRGTGHTLVDFRLLENGDDLPINVKTANARFNRARELVGVDPDDCVPIPAYKAHAAVESVHSLLYAVSVDFELVQTLDQLLPSLLTQQESIVWDLLNRKSGAGVRRAEDFLVFQVTTNHWDRIKETVLANPFHVISARKAIRILQTKPKRTPGIGLRAWGTGVAGETNVHISLSEESTPWSDVAERIASSGIADVIKAVNRRRTEKVFDPEI